MYDMFSHKAIIMLSRNLIALDFLDRGSLAFVRPIHRLAKACLRASARRELSLHPRDPPSARLESAFWHRMHTGSSGKYI